MPRELLEGGVDTEPSWLPLVLKLVIFSIGFLLFVAEALKEVPRIDLLFLYTWLMGLPSFLPSGKTKVAPGI